MSKFNLTKILLGGLGVVLALDKILKDGFNSEILPFTLPNTAYYALLLLIGVFLLYKGLGFGAYHYS